MNRSLIIFARNLEYGKVKTRLAAEIGKSKAFEVYRNLLAHTYRAGGSVQADRYIYYSDYIDEHDGWEQALFKKKLQQGKDLGERMQHAFEEIFRLGYNRAVLIGSDCPGLDKQVMEQAFAELEEKDVVIGPAKDGGYYLIGLKKMITGLFQDKLWSTPAVLAQTIESCRKQQVSIALLAELNDIDNKQDLDEFLRATAKRKSNAKLLIVSNAGNDLLAGVTAQANELVDNDKSLCSLCSLTKAGGKGWQEWNTFMQQLPQEAECLNKESFRKRYPFIIANSPAVYLEEQYGLKQILSPDEINAFRDLDELRSGLLKKVQHYLEC